MRNLIIGFILGAGVGSGITYLLYKRHVTRAFNAALDERAAEEYEKVKKEFEDRDIALAEAEAQYSENLKGPVAAAASAMRRYRGEDVEEDMAEAESPSEYDEDDPEDAINKEENDLIEKAEIEDNIQKELEKSRPKCKILKAEHFGEIEGYECETLTFYVQDKMLVHENGELVEDIPFLIDDALDRYGWADDDKDESPLYVRNYGLMRDYDIQKVFDEWHGAD